MSYERVGDILERIRNYHSRIRHAYQSLAGAHDDERLRILLEYMGRHENYFERSLGRYGAQEIDTIKQTYLQYVPDDQIKRSLEETELDPSMEPDEIVRRSIEFDRGLVTFYRGLATTQAPPRVRELFESMIKLEETMSREHAKMLADLDPQQGGTPPKKDDERAGD